MSTNPTDARPAGAAVQPDEDRAGITKITWDDSTMQTTFANVINVINTREEFTLLFGTNQTWNISTSRELTVRLSNRVVLTPYAAKRLVTLLAARVQDYERRFGEMSLDG